jgi:hypothetical protein
MILAIPIQLNSDYITIIWAFETVLLTIFFIKTKTLTFGLSSMIIGAITFSKTLIYDTFRLDELDTGDIFSSTRFISYLVTIFCFYIISILYDNQKYDDGKKVLPIVYSYAGTILAFVLILLEFEDYWISIFWSILALIIIILGFTLQKKHLRAQGMLIFSITIIKVFLYDTRNLETIFRTVSYIVLGAILLTVSFIYSKYREKLKEIL